MTSTGAVVGVGVERAAVAPRSHELRFTARDGWPLGAVVCLPASDPEPIDTATVPDPPGASRPGTVPGAVLVPGSRHERDAWAATAVALARCGVASLRLDVRGRGSSRGTIAHDAMGPRARRLVELDIASAIEALAGIVGVDRSRLVVVGEQDTAFAAAAAAAASAVAAGSATEPGATIGEATPDRRVVGLVLVSARNPRGQAWPHRGAHLPVLGLVSTEDRAGLRATVDAHLVGGSGSRLVVFRRLGVGITMASVRQFEQPDAEPIEDLIAGWVDEVTRRSVKPINDMHGEDASP